MTVSGSDISDQAVIMVGGMKGKVIGVRASEADFEIPELITSEVISAFPQLSKVSAITPAAVISDGGSNEDFATDGKYSSYYSSTNADCYIGVDLGEGKRALINRVRYFPYSKWTIAAKYIKGAVIEASVDGVTYT